MQPQILRDFSTYKITVQNRSVLTAEQYCTDLSLFFRFIIASQSGIDAASDEFHQIDISGVDIEFVKKISADQIYSFLMFVANSRDNNARTRARKLSAIKSFYKYLTVVRRQLDENPAKDIESPSIKQSLPKFLSLEESRELLSVVANDRANKNRLRDYAMMTIFLNCGIRLSELVGINLSDIDKDLRSMRVIGKGNKERIVYLNSAVRAAVSDYMNERKSIPDLKDKNALFVSRLGNRMSNKTVQYTVYKYLDKAGLGYKHYSTHKLRHTAATLMYRSGNVDVRVLKDILGHEQLNTTQIYTHVSDTQMESAMEQNPLSADIALTTEEE